MSNWDDEVNRHAAELVRLTLKAADQGPEPLPEDEVAELCARPGRGVLLAPHRGRSRSRGEADGSCVWTSPGSMGLRERHSGACEGARRPCARSSPRAAPVPVATTRGTDGRERRAASLSSSSRCSPPRICGATPSPCVTRKAPSMDSSRCGRSTGARSPTAISTQTVHGTRATVRLAFHFKDGSLHDETAVVFGKEPPTHTSGSWGARCRHSSSRSRRSTSAVRCGASSSSARRGREREPRGTADRVRRHVADPVGRPHAR